MLSKKYQIQEVEKYWREYWKKNEIYKWESNLPREETFVIDTPPPTVSGFLHMGHVFSYVQADFVARYQRMKGKTVYYPIGFDDNGLPTERLVEKVKNIKASDKNREEFVSICKKVIKDSEEEFDKLFSSMALSTNPGEQYQTISEYSKKISQLSFIDLYEKGLIEEKYEPVIWDIKDKTALSQADLIDVEYSSFMNYLKFQIKGTDESLIIATTRPELLPACVAIMVHPDDTRYKKFVGKKAITPMFGVEVSIIADELKLVKQDKGTGCVMCCTFGDENDIKWYKDNKLDLISIISDDGRIIDFKKNKDGKNYTNTICANKYYENSKKLNFNKETLYKNYLLIEGKIIYDARKIIIEELKTRNIIIKQEPITHVVKCGERSKFPVEFLSKTQWFVKIPKKEELINQANECVWHPSYMKERIINWIKNLSWDWCISRQRYFGVPIPIWKVTKMDDKNKNFKTVIPSHSDLPIDPIKNLPSEYKIISPFNGKFIVGEKNNQKYILYPETDIMDTWATSSLTPQLSSGGINSSKDGFCQDIERHKKLFPADLRPQAHEIIRSWAFYTILKSYLHEKKVPWKNLMISGWCLASDKTKMSKSKNNTITPDELIVRKGSDVVRYWSSTSQLGSDTIYDEKLLKIGEKLINKLFNACKFAANNFKDLKDIPNSINNDIEKKVIFCDLDLWILNKLSLCISKINNYFDNFQYFKAREVIEDIFWNDFCDNYLEIVKVRCYGLGAIKYQDKILTNSEKHEITTGQKSSIHTIYYFINSLLKLFSPFVPHITEELYSKIFQEEFDRFGSIHRRGSWPEISFKQEDKLLNIGSSVIKILDLVRKFKSDNNLSLKSEIKHIIIKAPLEFSSNLLNDIQNVTNSKKITFLKGSKETVKINIDSISTNNF